MKKSLLAAFIISVLAGCASQQAEEPVVPEDTMTAEQTAAEAAAQAEAARIEGLKAAAQAADRVFYFEFDSSVLNSSAQMALDAHAALLVAIPRNVSIEGHADERGTREYNMALGERRANAVRDYLMVQGVDGSLIETISYGEEQPIAGCSDESCWSQNRRAELK